MNTKLNNKQKNIYKGLINKKLDQMGISKEPRTTEVCRKPMLAQKSPGIFETVMVPRFMLQSVRRQMRTQLLESGERVIKAFLSMDSSKLKKGIQA